MGVLCRCGRVRTGGGGVEGGGFGMASKWAHECLWGRIYAECGEALFHDGKGEVWTGS